MASFAETLANLSHIHEAELKAVREQCASSVADLQEQLRLAKSMIADLQAKLIDLTARSQAPAEHHELIEKFEEYNMSPTLDVTEFGVVLLDEKLQAPLKQTQYLKRIEADNERLRKELDELRATLIDKKLMVCAPQEKGRSLFTAVAVRQNFLIWKEEAVVSVKTSDFPELSKHLHGTAVESWYPICAQVLRHSSSIALVMDKFVQASCADEDGTCIEQLNTLWGILLKLPSFPQEEFLKILDCQAAGRVQTLCNLHNIWKMYSYCEHLQDGLAWCLFNTGCLLSHSCKPNSRWTIKNGIFRVCAKQDLLIGDEVTINYDPRGLKLQDGVLERRRKLHKQLNFVCYCNSCVTEANDAETLYQDINIPSKRSRVEDLSGHASKTTENFC